MQKAGEKGPRLIVLLLLLLLLLKILLLFLLLCTMLVPSAGSPKKQWARERVALCTRAGAWPYSLSFSFTLILYCMCTATTTTTAARGVLSSQCAAHVAYNTYSIIRPRARARTQRKKENDEREREYTRRWSVYTTTLYYTRIYVCIYGRCGPREGMPETGQGTSERVLRHRRGGSQTRRV